MYIDIPTPSNHDVAASIGVKIKQILAKDSIACTAVVLGPKWSGGAVRLTNLSMLPTFDRHGNTTNKFGLLIRVNALVNRMLRRKPIKDYGQTFQIPACTLEIKCCKSVHKVTISRKGRIWLHNHHHSIECDRAMAALAEQSNCPCIQLFDSLTGRSDDECPIPVKTERNLAIYMRLVDQKQQHRSAIKLLSLIKPYSDTLSVAIHQANQLRKLNGCKGQS